MISASTGNLWNTGMLTGISNRSSFGFSPPLAGHDHIGIVAPTTGTNEPLMPIENRRLGTVSSRHFGGIGLNLMSAFEAPDDEPNTGSRRTPECHRWAEFGLHLTASAVSSATRRLITLR